MHVLFCHDTYYARDAKGQAYAYGAFPYALWAERFLPHFDRISVIGREKPFNPADIKALDMSSGDGIEHILLPNINTPLQRLSKGRDIYAQIRAQVMRADAVIIRGPVEFGMMAAKAARALGKPYAVEMSGCAFDNVWNHGSLTGKLYAPLKYRQARAMVEKADQVMYVTENFLQKRYPSDGYTDFASNVEIELPVQTVLDARLNRLSESPQKLVFGLIGNFNNRLKGLDVALSALSYICDELPEFELRILGQGDKAQWEEKISRYFGLIDRVVFSGCVPGGPVVLDWLDELDIYLQPSFHEGLPRGLIEAMSRGLPALASDAGGIPELLSPEFIHRKGHYSELGEGIYKLATDAPLRKNAAMQNFEKAKDYTKDKLAPRRAEFWARFAQMAKERAS